MKRNEKLIEIVDVFVKYTNLKNTDNKRLAEYFLSVSDEKFKAIEYYASLLEDKFKKQHSNFKNRKIAAIEKKLKNLTDINFKFICVRSDQNVSNDDPIQSALNSAFKD